MLLSATKTKIKTKTSAVALEINDCDVKDESRFERSGVVNLFSNSLSSPVEINSVTVFNWICSLAVKLFDGIFNLQKYETMYAHTGMQIFVVVF